MKHISVVSSLCELRTLRTQDTLEPGHCGTSLMGPNCPDRLALVSRCPKDSSNLSAELSCTKCRTLLPVQCDEQLAIAAVSVQPHLNSTCIDGTTATPPSIPDISSFVQDTSDAVVVCLSVRLSVTCRCCIKT